MGLAQWAKRLKGKKGLDMARTASLRDMGVHVFLMAS